jgi:hypothetical protein
MIRPSHGRAATLLVAIALAVVACGGAAESPTNAPTPPAQSAPPTVAPATDPPTDTGGPPSPGLPGIDLSDIAGALDGVDSYRMTVTVDGEVTYSATVIRAPVEAQAIEIGTTRIVRIGDEAWLDAGAGSFQSVEPDMVAGMANAFDPILLFGAYGQMGDLGGLTDLGTESKNGVQARHLRIDASTPLVGASVPPGATIDIWVADQGFLVSYAVTGFDAAGAGGDLVIDVTNVNDPANRVDRP